MKTITKYAREHRKNPTPAEIELKRKLLIWKISFRSQRQFDFYIVDFLIQNRRLVIEVDGGYHLDEIAKLNDDKRTKYLNSLGLEVIRITNDEVLSTDCYNLKLEILRRKEVDLKGLPTRHAYGRAKY